MLTVNFFCVDIANFAWSVDGLYSSAQNGEVRMARRIGVFAAALMACLTIGLLNASPASAAPITCPGGQVATKTADGWDCVNRGGNDSNAEDPKNPNAGKGFF